MGTPFLWGGSLGGNRFLVPFSRGIATTSVRTGLAMTAIFKHQFVEPLIPRITACCVLGMSTNYGHLNAGKGGKNKSKKEKIRLDKWNLRRYNTQAVWWTASKTGRTARKPRKKPKKDEKTSWQTVFFVVTYSSSQRSERLYLVNWITQRRTRNTLDN